MATAGAQPDGRASVQPAAAATANYAVTAADDAFLEDLSRRSFRFFWDEADPATGIVRDRARTDGSPHDARHRDIGSIAAVGFGLSSLCIAAERGWVPREEAVARARITLRFFAERSPHERGWFYHFVNIRTGAREWKSEVSSIDTALLVAGALTVRRCFDDDAEIVQAAQTIYHRIDFPWMLNGHPHLLAMGWRPESGFIEARWKHYCELIVLYLLAIGSPTHPIPADAWQAWLRPTLGFGPYEYVSWHDPLFVHQFSHAWVDLRARREARPPYVDWWENSVVATLSHKAFNQLLAPEFPGYSEHIWGFTASDSARGYVVWHGPPRHEEVDGNVAPFAAGGSLMFTPEISLAALREMHARFGDRLYGKYGFADAFNPTTGWVNPDVIGIDTGMLLLSAENLRTGRVWAWFMANPEIDGALTRVGLVRAAPPRAGGGLPVRGRPGPRAPPARDGGLHHYEFIAPPAPEADARNRGVVKATAAIATNLFETGQFTAPDGVVLKYRLLRPRAIPSGTRHPLVLVLHGSGEIGTDNATHMNQLPKYWARDDIRRQFPAYVVVPQFPARSVEYTGPATDAKRAATASAPLDAALALVDRLKATLPIDAERVYVTGFSMGGSSTWLAAARRPDLFAAAVPFAGVGDEAKAGAIAATPVWAVHGNADTVNVLRHQRAMFDALSRCPGATMVFWEFDRLGHEVPPMLQAGDEVARWLFAHRKPAGSGQARTCF